MEKQNVAKIERKHRINIAREERIRYPYQTDMIPNYIYIGPTPIARWTRIASRPVMSIGSHLEQQLREKVCDYLSKELPDEAKILKDNKSYCRLGFIEDRYREELKSFSQKILRGMNFGDSNDGVSIIFYDLNYTKRRA